jgi:preprotein translocase subunit SecD
MAATYLKYTFAGLALLFGLLAFARRQRRASWTMAALLAASAGAAAHYDAFWLMAASALGAVWALFCTTNAVDLAWRVKAGLVAAVALGSFLCMWPTLDGLTQGKVPCPRYVEERVDFRLVAGLDLRGGLRLVYTVDVEEAIKDKRDRYFDEMRQELGHAFGLAPEDKPIERELLVKLGDKVLVEKARGDAATINVAFRDPGDISKLEGKFATRFGAEMVRSPAGRPGAVVYKIRGEVESGIRERAVNQAKETINKRVDELGLREASVTVRDEDIIIEVPGQDEKTFQDIREIISKTARLEFKLVDDGVDFFEEFGKGKAAQESLPPGLSFFREDAPYGPGKTNPVTQARMTKLPSETMRQARERLKEWLTQFSPPTDHEIGIGPIEEPDEAGQVVEVGWRTYYLYSKTEVTGDQVRDAQATPDQGQRSTGGWYVALAFTESGATRFEEITGANVQKRFAIILDDNVTTAPRILSKIAGGHATITMGAGDADRQLAEARQLELVLRSGALPAPITPSNEQRIGASLGSDSIRQGIVGALIGVGLVLVFMAFYYHVAGVVADLAVLFNLFLQLAILATFGASMTLPGIAGLALTVGMAVDANVLINERIREEVRQGKSPRAAVDLGYDKAFSAIIDGHMTTIISGLILAQYGTGPIKGFAVTLLVGMIASLFTSVVCTRLAFDWWVRGRRSKTLSVG